MKKGKTLSIQFVSKSFEGNENNKKKSKEVQKGNKYSKKSRHNKNVQHPKPKEASINGKCNLCGKYGHEPVDCFKFKS